MKKSFIWKLDFELGLEGFRKMEIKANDFLNDKWHRGPKAGEYRKFS